MSLRNRHMHGYSEIRFTSTEYVTLLNHYGLAGRNLLGSTKPLPNKAELNQDVLNLVEPGRDLAQVRGRSSFTTPEEKDIYLARLNELKAVGGMSRDDMERLAMEAVEEWRISHDLPF